MIEENKHINYSAADIERYRKGEMPAADMHAMEKAALEDLFLADAMEGYGVGNEESKVAQDNFQPAITELRQRLAERVSEKEKAPVIKFNWWKVAAVILVVMGAGWLYNNASKNKTADNSIVKNDDIKKEVPLPAKTDSTKNFYHTNDTTAIALRDVAASEKKLPATKADASPLLKAKEATSDSQSAVATNNAPVEKNKTAVDEQEQLAFKKSNPPGERTAAKTAEDKAITANAPKKDMQTADDVNKQTDKLSAAPVRKAQGFAATANKPVMNGRANNAGFYANTFNGTIVDQSNRAVPNASIQIPNLNIATQTNKWGNFSFRAPDTSLSVSIASEGFETQNLDLTYNSIASTNNLITLKPRLLNVNDTTLNIDANQKTKKRSKAYAKGISIKILEAEPVIGWNAYNEYLEKNKRVTEETNNIHGNVIVTFQVHSKWTGSFVITQSLSEELDEEAIRLIKEGPAWKLLKDKKATVSVTVRF